jgi:hypothetical protein
MRAYTWFQRSHWLLLQKALRRTPHALPLLTTDEDTVGAPDALVSTRYMVADWSSVPV